MHKSFSVSRYEGFREASSTEELLAEGNSIVRMPPEPVLPLPRPIIRMGKPAFGRETPMAPIELHIAKLSNVLVMPSKMMIDLATDSVLIDSFKYLSPGSLAFPGKRTEVTEEEWSELKQKAIRIPGTTFAATCASNGFGHILLEAFSQFYGFEALRPHVDRVLVNRTHGYYPEVFEALGITPRMKVIQDRPFLCETLLVPRQSYILDRSISHRYVAFMDQLGARLTRGMAPAAERIYVSRTGAEKRRLLGEDRLEAFLAAKGFEIIRPEGLSFAAQVNLFRHARVVAGCVGSALYNCIFSAPDVQRMIFAPNRFYTRNDLMLGRKLTSPPHYFFGESLANNAREAMLADWTIDLDALERRIDEVIAGW